MKGILLSLDFLYLVATQTEIQALIQRLNHISLQKKSQIIKEIVEINNYLKKDKYIIPDTLPTQNNKKSLFQNHPYHQEISVMSGGFEMTESVVRLGYELYNHWDQFKKEFRSFYDASNVKDIDIFQYWLLLWLKIMDGIHDFVGSRSEPTQEERKSINLIINQVMKETKITIHKNDDIFTKIDIINFLLNPSNVSTRTLTIWERDQFKEERVNKIFDTFTASIEDQFIHAVPITLFIEIQYHHRKRITPGVMGDIMKHIITKNLKPKNVSESKKDFIELMERYNQYITPLNHPHNKDNLVQSLVIFDYDTRTRFYGMLKMQQLIHNISQTKNNEIPLTIDATHRRVLFDKYFLPYTYATKGFQIVIDLLFNCEEEVSRNFRKIIYQAFLLVLDETMTKDKKKIFYKDELLPQIQSINANHCENIDDKEMLEETKNIFPQLIHKILYIGGVIDEDINIDDDKFDNLLEVDIEFGEMNQLNKVQSQEDLQWARKRMNQTNQLHHNKTIITGLRKHLEEIKNKIRDRHSPRKDFGRKIKKEFLDIMKENYNRLDILYRNQIENLTTNIELMNYYGETDSLDEMRDMLKSVSEKRRIYLDEIENYMTQIRDLNITDLTSVDKSVFEEELNKILDRYANIFSADYLYTDYQTIFWKNYLVHYRSDATIWDASLQKEGVHTDSLMKKYKYRCDQRPTYNVFGEFQKKLYSDYYLELGGITEEECNKIQHIEYRGDEGYTVNHFKPQEYHSVSFLSCLIRWKLGIQKLDNIQQNIIEEYLKKLYRESVDRETSYIAFLLSVPVGTLLSIKRSGDWSQIQHCIRTGTFFASFDKLALFYGFFRGCGMFQFRGNNQFVGCCQDEDYQKNLLESLNRIGSVLNKISQT